MIATSKTFALKRKNASQREAFQQSATSELT